MKNIFNKNLSLILIFLFPALFIIVAGLVIYLPSSRLKSEYSFIYANCMNPDVYYTGYQCREYISIAFPVVDGKITQNPSAPSIDLDKDGKSDFGRNLDVRFFVYDWNQDSSRQITTEEALSLKVSNLLMSPDGITLMYGYGTGGGFLFGSNYPAGYYAIKGKYKKKLNIFSGMRDYYGEEVKFIGWSLTK